MYFVELVEVEALRPAGAPLERSINSAYFRQISTNPPPGWPRLARSTFIITAIRRKSQQVGNSLVNDACQGYGGKNVRDQASRIYVKERWEYCATALGAAKYDKLQDNWRSF
jgi:hypothetical protein